MLKKYFCKYCNYATDRLSSYKLHLNTKKHLKNIVKPTETHRDPQRPIKTPNNNIELSDFLSCTFCGKKLSKACHRARHEKTCAVGQLQENTRKHNDEKKDQTIGTYVNIINELKKQVNKLTDMVANKPTAINNTINNTINNVRSYAQKHYSNAEELKSLDDGDYGKTMLDDNYSHDKDAINILINDGLIKPGEKAMILCKEDIDPFVKNLISYTRMNTLHKTLGDFIIDIYVKKDKSKQPIHLTDSSRMKFIYTRLQDSIDETIKDKNIEWTNDPKGVKIVKIMIDPMLKYMSHQVRIYQKNLAKNFVEDSSNIGVNKIDDMLALQSLMNMCLKDNKRNKKYELRKKILDYIAPHFQFNNKLLIENACIKN